MLARLQTFTTLAAWLGAVVWAGWAWQAGHTLAAVLGAALLVAGYTLVLALEFVLLVLTHGDDRTARASGLQLLRAWWAEAVVGARVFYWQQPFASQRWPDRLPGSSAATPPSIPARRGVLLIHGYVCNRGLWNTWLARLHVQGTPFVAVNLEPVFGSLDAYMGAIDEAVSRLRQATGLAPVVVAHSMGGLALRRWWAEQTEGDVLHHVITIGTPHQGTWLARWAHAQNGKQMRSGGAWLLNLQERERGLLHRRSRMTCFFSHCDNIVFPPSSATLLGATNQHLVGAAHVDMLTRPEPWQELQRKLSG